MRSEGEYPARSDGAVRGFGADGDRVASAVVSGSGLGSGVAVELDTAGGEAEARSARPAAAVRGEMGKSALRGSGGARNSGVEPCPKWMSRHHRKLAFKDQELSFFENAHGRIKAALTSARGGGEIPMTRVLYRPGE